MAIDLNDVDVPQNIVDPEVHKDLSREEIVKIVEKNIKDQYVHFENLGRNYFMMFQNELLNGDKVQLLNDLIYYVNKNLITISDIDNLDGNASRTLVAGIYIYEFICIDCYSSLIPAFMETISITSIEELDRLINTKYLDSPGIFKQDFLKTIQITIEQLLKLQQITPDVNKDKNYQKLLGKYYYYQEIVEYGDTEMFLKNYIRPVLSKHSTDFLWKLL